MIYVYIYMCVCVCMMTQLFFFMISVWIGSFLRNSLSVTTHQGKPILFHAAYQRFRRSAL